jgi:hypothetical protein
VVLLTLAARVLPPRLSVHRGNRLTAPVTTPKGAMKTKTLTTFFVT